MKIKRSPDLVLAGYFLARCTQADVNKPGLPPPQLGTNQWRRAYLGFYRTLAGDREMQSFANSLKNTRDGFDGHFSTGRIGWRSGTEDREPRPLSTIEHAIFDRWASKTDEELWHAVRPMFDPDVLNIPTQVIDDIEAEDYAGKADATARTEGAEKYAMSRTVERDPKLRAGAIKLHGLTCRVCEFNFQLAYGDWGSSFIEVHHSRPLGQSGGQPVMTDPITDLTVVCANCHRMLHRKKGKVLTVEELRAKLTLRSPPSVP